MKFRNVGRFKNARKDAFFSTLPCLGIYG